MKKKTILLPLICALIYIVLSSRSGGPGLMAGAERTGATGTPGCTGSGCHAPTSDTIGLFSQLLPTTGGTTTTYTPGVTYNLRIYGANLSPLTLPKYGFQVSCVQGTTTTNAGTFTAPAGTHTVSASSINIVEHTTPLSPTTGTGGMGTTYEILVPWTAPAAGTGNVKFFVTMNAVNNNGATTGDISRSTAIVINEAGALAPITGTFTVCAGSTTTLSDATPGGTWSSGSGAATIGSSTGIVTGVIPGTATIVYSTSTVGSTSIIMTVYEQPGAIAGVPAVCPGGVTTLTNATAGGSWSSSATGTATVGSSTGIVTGVASGTAIITYAMPVGGCYSTKIVTVNTVPAIAGTSTLCVGGTTTLTHSVTGGSWSSGSTSTATVGSSSGVVTGVAAGTAVITYAFGTSGCYTTSVVTVNGVPVAGPMTGPDTVCVGYSITKVGATPGGTWTSLATTKATVNATTGVVTGVATGTATIKYKVTTACGTDSVTKVVVVKAATTGGCNVGTVNTAVISGELHVYPNPNRGAFTLSLLANTSDDAHIVVTNLVGTKVNEFTITPNKATDIKLNQPPGVYFIMAISGDKKYVAKVMVE